MHLFSMGVFTDIWRSGEESLRPFLESVVRDRVIWGAGAGDPKMNTAVSVSGNNDTTRKAEKVDGGYRINGRAGFNTLCACADFFGTTAHYDDPEKGPMCLFFFLPIKTLGIKIQSN